MDTNTSIEDALILWADVVGMSADLGDPTLPQWLERLQPVSLENGVMTLCTRQKWTERKVMTEYRDIVEQLLFETTLEPIKLNVVLSNDASYVAGGATPAQRTPVAPASTKPAVQATPVAQVPQPAAPIIETPQKTARQVQQAPQQQQDQPSPAALAGAAYATAHGGAGEGDAGQAYVSGLSPAQMAAREVYGIIEKTAGPAPIIDSRSLPPRPAGDEESAQASETAAETVPAAPMPVLEDGAMPQSALGPGFSDFNFDTYIVGEANTVAFSMAHAVAEQPGNFQNPLFIWGPSGNGKTHLLLSIINYIHEHQPAMNTRYVSATTFVNQYVDDIRNKKLKGSEVLKEYRDIDVLLVDDVQSFKDKQETVSTFFEIFNQLIFDGKQIVLAADVAPDYLELDPRMQTRFGQGLVVDIKAPTYEMKRSILMSFYERYRARKEWCGVDISGEVFDTIAQFAPNNPRSMQGLINTLMAMADVDPNVLTPEGVKSTINDLFKSTNVVDVPAIIRAVSENYSVSVDDIRGKSRTRNISEARQVVMWMARQLTDESYENIGAELGGRDHSTVYYGISTIEKRVLADRAYSYKLDRIKKEIVG